MKQHRLDDKAEKLKTATIKCDYCDLMFLTDRSKIYHMKITHWQYKPYKCTECTKEFHTNKSLSDHRYCSSILYLFHIFPRYI